MSGQRRRDTAPEVALRRRLHAAGLRYRVNYPVPGNRRRTIDIAFPGSRLAVFVDGCFWHACPHHGVWPSSNQQWWDSKLRRNIARDRDTDALLNEQGWSVLRLWEHERAEEGAEKVAAGLAALRLAQ